MIKRFSVLDLLCLTALAGLAYAAANKVCDLDERLHKLEKSCQKD